MSIKNNNNIVDNIVYLAYICKRMFHKSIERLYNMLFAAIFINLLLTVNLRFLIHHQMFRIFNII